MFSFSIFILEGVSITELLKIKQKPVIPTGISNLLLVVKATLWVVSDPFALDSVWLGRIRLSKIILNLLALIELHVVSVGRIVLFCLRYRISSKPSTNEAASALIVIYH